MKILLLTDGLFPFQIGGMQKHSIILAQHLAEKGCQLHLVHCGGENYSHKKMRSLFPSTSWSNIRETVIPFPELDGLPGHYIRENKRYSKQAYLAIKKEIKDNNEATFDLVYAQGFTGWYFINERDQGNWKSPVLVNFHGFEMFQKAPSLKVKAAYVLLKSAVRTIIRKADYVYSFGGHIHPLLLMEGVKEEQLLLHSNGIDASWLNDGVPVVNETRKFIFIGRYERRKGVEELSQVLELFSSSEKAFEFEFIGPIPDNKKVDDPRITYLGEIREELVIQERLKKADCLVCPSHSEGMPTVILEAMASGLAIIATDVGAISRQVSNNGFLLAQPEVSLIKKSMEKIIDMPASDLLEMKANSIQEIKAKFLWTRVIQDKWDDFHTIQQSNSSKSLQREITDSTH